MATCSSADSVIEAASQIKSNATKLNTFVNGTSTQTVQLGTGDPTPVLRKLVADAQDIIALAANDAAETALDAIAANTQNKADKFVPAEPGNLARLSSDGNLRDSGWAAEDFVPLLNYTNNEAQELIWQNAVNNELRQHKDAILANTDALGDLVPLLTYAKGEALDLALLNRMNIEVYDEWYARGISHLNAANIVAMQVIQNIRDLIGAFDESYAQHRLQIRLFDGTNPTSSSKPVLFVISGQSNAVGSGEYGAFDHAEDCGQFWLWRNNANELKPIKDSTGQAFATGSQWPEFARLFFALTGRKVILLNIANGGAAVTDGGYTTDNTWADNGYGTLRTSRQAIWDAFSAVVSSDDYDVGAILWSQGEAEAGRLYAGTVTVSDYKTGTLDVLEWTRELIGDQDCPVFNCMIGYRDTAANNPELKATYKAIQDAQLEIFNSEDGLYNICSMPPLFASAWSEYMYGIIHYSHTGYKIVGEAFARASAHYLSL